MNELPLLFNITIAIVIAFMGGMLARKLGLPPIVGYLLAGVVIGPFSPGFVGDYDTIYQLAELGVIFLMFGVGLHFSFEDLFKVKDVAIPGALFQSLFSTLLGLVLTLLWGWTWQTGLVMGLSISVASTVVLLRNLMDHSLLQTSHGQAAIGWLIMEDILSVLILVIMPALVPNPSGFDWQHLAFTLLKAIAFIFLMMFIGKKLLPSLLDKVAHTRSRELFILAVLAITLGIAMGSATLFGVSLALGAFMAGAIINQSPLSYQVGADVFSFREAFSVLFFVSVGMLVNPVFVWQHMGQVLALTLLVILGKFLIVLFLGFFIHRPARTFLVVGVGVAQIGEFSFILGQGGMKLGLMTSDQYAYLLAASLISISLNPFLYNLLPWLEKNLQKIPGFWGRLETSKPLPIIDENALQDHVVIIGYGPVGKHMVDVLLTLNISMLVIENNTLHTDKLIQQQVPVLYGDASNSEVITHAGLQHARALVITIADESANALIISATRDINPNLMIITRASTEEGIRLLSERGANYVVQAELEGGLELVSHTLMGLGYPLRQVHEYTMAVRRDNYNYNIEQGSGDEIRSLHRLIEASNELDLIWVELPPDSPILGQSLAGIDMRSRTGASVVAIIRDHHLTANPKSGIIFESRDRLGLIGEENQIEKVRQMVYPPQPPKPEQSEA